LLGFLSRWSVSPHNIEIKSIVNEFHWSPKIIDNLYCDDIDHHGLIYWFEHLKEVHSKLKNK